MITVSVIICTRNRAESLRDTLASIAKVTVPQDEELELLVVDNGSTDQTQAVFEQASLPQFCNVRLIEELRPGVSHARNTAASHADGDILLFTDDDIRVPKNWITGMIAPIRSGRADAVAGGVKLAPHLQRSWQDVDPWLTSLLATTHTLDPDTPQRMVGANMAVARHVFQQLPPFDPNLDAGSPIGLGGETLFSLQLQNAGFHLAAAFSVVVEHHCNPDRLSRMSYLKATEKVGRSQGYIDYHFKGAPIRPVRHAVELGWRYVKLAVGCLLRYSDTRQPEGLPGWEMALRTQIYHRLQLIDEWGSLRKYTEN